MLLLICTFKSITYKKIVEFMKKTYFYFGLTDKSIPVDEFLRIRPITACTILRLHSDPTRIEKFKPHTTIEIQNLSPEKIEALVSVQNDVKLVSVNCSSGLQCSCNHFKNNAVVKINKKFNYSFCIHMEQFFDYIVRRSKSDKKFDNYFTHLLNSALKET